MSIPITKRVMTSGGKKGCGCHSGCNCGKAPAKMWGAAKVEHGEKSSPAKQAAYPKNLKEKTRAASSREEREAIKDNYMDSLYTQRVNKGEKLSRNRQRGWEKIKERQASRKQSPVNKKSCGSKRY